MTARRIIYLWDADYPWDIRTEKTCLTLAEGGHQVHIVARNRNWLPTEEKVPEGTIHRMEPWRWAGQRLDGALGFPAFFNLRWINLLAETVKETRADLIIARDLPLCPTAIRVGRRASIPVIFDMAEKYPEMMQAIFDNGRQTWMDYLVRNPRMVSRVEDYCLRNVDRVLVVVDEAAEALAAFPQVRCPVDVVSNTPPRSLALAPAVPRHTGKTVELAYLGVMEIQRGIPEIIAAVGQLRSNGLPVRLRLIGGGRDLELFRSQAQALGIASDGVIFYGHVPSRDEAMRLLAESDIGVCSQRSGTLSDWIIPNKIFDYMALGLPVLSSDSKPCARIIRETGAGAVYRSMDPSDAARAIRELLSVERRQACGVAGRQAILDRLNWETDAERLLHAIDVTR